MANLRRYNDGLVKLDQWIRQLLDMDDSERIYNAICEGTCNIICAEAAAFTSIDTENKTITYTAISGALPCELQGRSFPLEKHNLCGITVAGATSARVASFTQEDRSGCKLLSKLNADTGVFAPVFEEGKVIGCLSGFRRGEPFDLIDEQLLQQYAFTTSSVLHNKSLIRSMRAHAEELEREIRTRKRAERRLKEAHTFLNSIVDGVADPLAVVGLDHVLMLSNRAAKTYYGISEQSTEPDHCYKVFHDLEEPCYTKPGISCPLHEVRRTGETMISHHNRILEGGEKRHVEIMTSPLMNGDGGFLGVIESHRDITDRKKAEETIKKMAYYDALTGLPNRRLFNDRLQQSLALANRHNRLLAVLFLDLDRFKIINDTLGHNAGDTLLKEVADRLRDCCKRQHDTVARQGGDEFIIILSEISDVKDAVRVAQNILATFEIPFLIGAQELFITSSIGISVYPFDGTDSEELVKNADVAMYRAKDQGRNNSQLYSPTMNIRAHERLSMENSLRKAMEREEFLLHYQPKVDVNEGTIVCMEALLRWQHPVLGLVPPAEFIPLAEETGLIVPLGEWVLRTACSQNKAWQDAGHGFMQVAVNLSARQFQQGNLVEMISTVLFDTGLDPRWLVIEVTESIMMQNVSSTTEILAKLNSMGVQIYIDDFGTGYSSLNYLKKFPIHALKIDQSFIRDITVNSDDAAIAKAVINMAGGLKLKVIAEGVETMDQLEVLRALKCSEMQGYFFSKPVPAIDFPPLLKDQKWALLANYGFLPWN